MQNMKHVCYQRWARRLIACYPACWRQRYAEEMLLIIEDTQPTLKTMLNLFLSLFDAYLHQDLITERIPSTLQRMRSNELSIYGAALIFFVPWLFVKGHFVDFVHGGGRNLSQGFAFTASPFLNILPSVSRLLPLFILLGGLPILLAACWQALKGRKVRPLFFCLLSLISPLLITSIIAIKISPIGGFLAPFSIVIGLGLSLALIAFSVKHVTPSQRITHYALFLATGLPLVMLIGLTTLLLKVIPSLVMLFLTGDISYVLRTNLLILIMIGAFLFSLNSLKKAFQARGAIQTMSK
jgi:hypothetical protein